MDKNILAVLILIAAVLAASFAGCTETNAPAEKTADNASEKTVFIVGIDGEYPPYSFIDSDGNAQGFDVDSVKWIAQNQGFEVTIKPMAWDSIIPSLNAGKIDMVYSGMTITEERLGKVNFSQPYLQVDQGLAFNNDSELTADDFKSGKTVVGAQRGTTGAIWTEENLIETGLMPADNLKYYDNFPSVVTDLQNKRIDVAIYDVPSLRDSIAGKPIEIRDQIDTGEVYGIAIRKEDTELLSKMNQGLENLRNDPYWQQLLEEYKLVGASPK